MQSQQPKRPKCHNKQKYPQLEQSESTGDEQEMPVDVEWQEDQTSENDEWSVGW